VCRRARPTDQPKALLDGFYDPCSGVDKGLLVHYEFKVRWCLSAAGRGRATLSATLLNVCGAHPIASPVLCPVQAPPCGHPGL
jgi:hypothetical protein